MTREENQAKLVALRAEVDGLVKSYNEYIGESKVDEAAKADETMSEKIAEYTSIARTMCFDECKAADDPMLKAVELLSFLTIKVKDDKPEGAKFPVRSVEEKAKPINLIKLNTYCGGIGHDKNWVHMVQKLNFLLTVQTAKDLGIKNIESINKSYVMSEIAKEIKLGKTPTSGTQMLKTLQTIVTAMVGEGYKATSHDVNYLLMIYRKKSSKKALTVACSNHAHFCRHLAEVCHRITVPGAGYGLECKEIKEG